MKIYTGQNLIDTTGPITMTTGKRRITIFECSNDIHIMTDLAKIADLVLLMIDGSYGIEMETFEFLNQLQLHGLPKVIGLLTHLDKFKLNKSLQRTKKALKHRFWTEIYDGAKMFDFSGIVNGKYLKHEVKRLSLHMSRIKFRPLVWRNSHPYLLVDRIEDVTPSSLMTVDQKCDRDVTFYGYVRGAHLKTGMKVHLVGIGDYPVENIVAVEDPCPISDKRSQFSSLRNEYKLFAPMANIGKLHMDRDGVYIDVKKMNHTPANASKKDANDSTPLERLVEMNSTQIDSGIDQEIKGAELSLFVDTRRCKSSVFSSSKPTFSFSNDVSSADKEIDGVYEKEAYGSIGCDGISTNNFYDDDNDEYDSDGNGHDKSSDIDERDMKNIAHDIDGFTELSETVVDSRWKQGMEKKAALLYEQRSNDDSNDYFWMTKIYGVNWAKERSMKLQSQDSNLCGSDMEDDNEHDELFPMKSSLFESIESKYMELNAVDCNRRNINDIDLVTWKDAFSHSEMGIEGDQSNVVYEKTLPSFDLVDLKNKFVTGNWASQSMKSSVLRPNVIANIEDNFGGAELRGHDENDSVIHGEEDVDYDKEEENLEMENRSIDAKLRSIRANQKLERKMNFVDEHYQNVYAMHITADETEEAIAIDALMKKRKELQKRSMIEFGDAGEEMRFQYEGFRQGIYVRILIRGLPAEFMIGFQPEVPLILGGIVQAEETLGFITARVKKHRWHKRILKSQDPLIFSVGWRRFQTIPTYATEDSNDRRRYLKYTPEYMHTLCTFYGPKVPLNTNIMAFQRDSNRNNFRICLTGSVLEISHSQSIVKKLKLVGTPTKIFRKTAFISGMFNSDLEIAKFIGASIKTVSGIRGQIKKVAREGDNGTFRATFEDKIQMSDIVFC